MKYNKKYIALFLTVVLASTIHSTLATQVVQVLGNSTSQYWIWVDKEGNVKRDDEAIRKVNLFSNTENSFQGLQEQEVERSQGSSTAPDTKYSYLNSEGGITTSENKDRTTDNNNSLTQEDETISFSRKWHDNEEKNNNNDEIILEKKEDNVSSENLEQDENTDNTEIKSTQAIQTYDNKGNITATIAKSINQTNEEHSAPSSEQESNDASFNQNWDNNENYNKINTTNTNIFEQKNIAENKITNNSEIKSTQAIQTHDNKGNITATIVKSINQDNETISLEKESYTTDKEEKITSIEKSLYSPSGEEIRTANYEYEYINNTKVLKNKDETIYTAIKGEDVIITENYKYKEEENTKEIEIIIFSDKKDENSNEINTNSEPFQQNSNNKIGNQKTSNSENKIIKAITSTLHFNNETNSTEEKINTVYNPISKQTITQKFTYQVEDTQEEKGIKNNKKESIQKKTYILSDENGKTIKLYTEEIVYDPKTNTKNIKKTLQNKDGTTSVVSSSCHNTLSL